MTSATFRPGAKLTINDLQQVKEAVYETRGDWRAIGLELGLKWHELTNIEGKDNDERLMKMLVIWLNKKTLSPSWETLVQALKAKAVGQEGVGFEIEEKFLQERDSGTEEEVQDEATVSHKSDEKLKVQVSSCCTVIIAICKFALLAVVLAIAVVVIIMAMITYLIPHTALDADPQEVVPWPFHKKKPSNTVGSNDLPVITGLFVGRDEDVDKITDILLGRDKPWVRAIFVYGPPAVGKSTLAMHVGYKMACHGTTVRYINMNDVCNFFEDNESSTASSSASASHHKSTKTDITSDPASRGTSIDVTKWYSNILFPGILREQKKYVRLSSTSLLDWAKSTESDTLLIMDNCDKLLRTNETKDNFLKLMQYLSQVSMLRVLTTHQHKVSIASVGFRYPLKNLSDKHAVELLHIKTSLSCSQDQAEVIAELVGNNPLALHVVGSLINENIPVNVVIKELHENLLDTLSPETLPSSERVRNVLELSLKYLQTKLLLCAFSLLVFPGSFSERAALAVLSNQGSGLCLRKLEHSSLLEHYWYAEESRYQYHTLIEDVLEERCILRRHCGLNVESKSDIVHRTFYSELLLELLRQHSAQSDDNIVGLLEHDRHNFRHLLRHSGILVCFYTDGPSDCYRAEMSPDIENNMLAILTEGKTEILTILFTPKELLRLAESSHYFYWFRNVNERKVYFNDESIALTLRDLMVANYSDIQECKYYYNSNRYPNWKYHMDCESLVLGKSVAYYIVLCCTIVVLAHSLLLSLCGVQPHVRLVRKLSPLWIIAAFNHVLWCTLDLSVYAFNSLPHIASVFLELFLQNATINICILQTALAINSFCYVDWCIYTVLTLFVLLLYVYGHPLLFTDVFSNTLNVIFAPVLVSVMWDREATYYLLHLFEFAIGVGFISKLCCTLYLSYVFSISAL